jgi:hypothetical protein
MNAAVWCLAGRTLYAFDMRPLCILVFATTACATMYDMKLPSQGGPRWVEYQSEHFRLQTDMDEYGARETVRQLEERRTGLLNAAWHGADFRTPRTRVVVFRSANELQEFVFRNIKGMWTLDARGEKLIVLGRDSRDSMRVFTHELTHDLGSSYFARQPRWLSEGMARFLETLQVDEAGGRVIIGVPDIEEAWEIHSLPALFRYDREGWGPDYEESWSLIFYLANYEGAQFNEYQKALFRGDEPDEAWRKAFPAYVTDDDLWKLQSKVNGAIRELRFSRRYKNASAVLQRYEGAIDLRVMPEPEIRALRAELFLETPYSQYEDDARRANAMGEARIALAQDPAQASAASVQIQLTDSVGERLALAEKAIAARPDDFRAWLLVDQALGDERETEERLRRRVSSLEKAVALAPENPWALQRLARASARSGNVIAAVPLIRKSLSIFPDSANALDSYAVVAVAQGDCKAAVALQTMAVNRLPHIPAEIKLKSKSSSRFLAWCDEVRGRLEVYQSTCR